MNGEIGCPKELISGFAADNCGSNSIVDVWYNGEISLGCDDLQKEVEDSLRIDSGDNESKSSNVCGFIKNGVSIAERRAIKCGFNAHKISTLCFKFGSPSSSSCGDSPYAAMSSGISPHTFLDSPVLLPNSQLSPTTGTFSSHPLHRNTQMVVSTSLVDAEKGIDGGSSTIHTETTLPYLPEVEVSSTGDLDQNVIDNTNCQSLTPMHPQLDFVFSPRDCEEVGMEIHDANSPPKRKISNVVNSHPSTVSFLKKLHENGPTMADDSGSYDSLDGDQNRVYPRSEIVRTTEDGYNWRKYGQKQVKGSEYPRSYYKCTHPSCLVKKKVERSPDGQITEIIYKDAHDHPKPQPYRKSISSSVLPFSEISEGDGSDSVWTSIQSGCKDVIESSWTIDGLKRTSSVSAMAKLPSLPSTNQTKSVDVLESTGTLVFSSTLASHDNDEEDNEPDMKRRKKDDCFPETTLSSRAIREPRVVIKIETEVDILDDGYRWRKYGQKVVKGNPNPRSYYKCTAPGCIVRKHVERSAESKKFVITTYEGKHNHDVPAARNNGHANSGSGSLSTAATNTQTAFTSTIDSHLPKPEPHTQDFSLYFDTKRECDTDFLRPNFLGNIGVRSPWFYPLKIPSSNNNLYQPYGLNAHHPAYISCNIMPTIPDLSFPFPPRFPVSYCNTEMSCSPIQPLYAGQPLREGHVGLLRPKQERRDDSFFKTDSLSNDRTDASSLVYNQSMETFES